MEGPEVDRPGRVPAEHPLERFDGQPVDGPAFVKDLLVALPAK